MATTQARSVSSVDDAKLLVRMDVCKTESAVTLLRIERDEIVPTVGNYRVPSIAVFSDQAVGVRKFSEGYVSNQWETLLVSNSDLKINNLASALRGQASNFSLSFPRGQLEFLSFQDVAILKDEETYYAGHWTEVAAAPTRPKYKDVPLNPACSANKTDSFMMTIANPRAPLSQSELGVWPAVGEYDERRIESVAPDGQPYLLAFRVCNEGSSAGKISELFTYEPPSVSHKFVVNYDRALSTPYSEVAVGGTIIVVPQNLVSVAGLNEARDGDLSKLNVSIIISRTEKWELSNTSMPGVVKFGKFTRGTHQRGDVWLPSEYLVGQLEPGFPEGLEACSLGEFSTDTIPIDEFSLATMKYCNLGGTAGTAAFSAIELSVTDTDPGLPEGVRGKTFTVPKSQIKGIIEGYLPTFTSWPEGFGFLYELHHHSICNPFSVRFDHARYAWMSTTLGDAGSVDGTCRSPALIGAPTWTTPFDEGAHRLLRVTEKTIGSSPPKRTYYHCPGRRLSPVCNYVPFTP